MSCHQSRLSKEFGPCVVRSFDCESSTSFRTVCENASTPLRRSCREAAPRRQKLMKKVAQGLRSPASCSYPSRAACLDSGPSSSIPQRRTTSCNAVRHGRTASRVTAGTRALLLLVDRNHRAVVTAHRNSLSRETFQAVKHHKQFLQVSRPVSVSVTDVLALGEAQNVVGSQVDGCPRGQNRLLRSTTACLGALRNNALPIVERSEFRCA